MNLMWQEQNQQLYRKFEFPDFKSAFEFMTLVAQKAETLQHHPTWTNTYNSVEIWLTTHDANHTVTSKDWQLAEEIDVVYDVLFIQEGFLSILNIDIADKSFEEIQHEMVLNFSNRKSNLQPTYAQHSLIQLKAKFLDILEDLCSVHQFTPEKTKAIISEFLKEIES